MPVYTYTHPKTGKTIDVVQSMKEDHVYIDEKGVKWQRIFHVPQASIDSHIDPFSSSEYVSKTRNKRGTLGDLEDKSAELSEKRTQIAGQDPIKEQYYKEWSKKRKGKKHPKNRKTDFEF